LISVKQNSDNYCSILPEVIRPVTRGYYSFRGNLRGVNG